MFAGLKRYFSEERRARLREVIHDSDTPGGKRFDIGLIGIILLSIALLVAESLVPPGNWMSLALNVLEALVTLAFTVEYALRVWTARQRIRWMTSFYGVLDLLALLPSFLSLFWPALRPLMVVRVVRLMRIFRILGLFNYVREAKILLLSLVASRHRIIVFMLAVLALVTVFGTIMYVVEPKEAGFTSIPRSIYWAVVTLTTVGYGDIAPVTWLGQTIASGIMILGYAIIAIPTGIVTVEMGRQTRLIGQQRICASCGAKDHAEDARYCRVCGKALG